MCHEIITIIITYNPIPWAIQLSLLLLHIILHHGPYNYTIITYNPIQWVIQLSLLLHIILYHGPYNYHYYYI